MSHVLANVQRRSMSKDTLYKCSSHTAAVNVTPAHLFTCLHTLCWSFLDEQTPPEGIIINELDR